MQKSTEMEPLLFVRKSSGLMREIGPWSALTLPLVLNLGVYLYAFLPLLPSFYPGCNNPLAFLIGGLIEVVLNLGIFLALVGMPRSGGNYLIISRGLHPILGVMEGYRTIIWNPVSIAILCFFGAKFIADALTNLGRVTQNTALVNMGTGIAGNVVYMIIISLIFMAVACLLDVMGVRWLKASWNVVFVINTAVLVVLAYLFLIHPNSSIPQVWDTAWGAGAYQEVMDVSTKAGFALAAFSWTATMAAIVTTVVLESGYTCVPLGGEISRPRVSFMWSFVLSAVILTVVTTFFAWAFQHTWGEFALRFNYLILTGKAAELKISPSAVQPSLTFYGALLTRSPLLSAFITLAPILGVLPYVSVNSFWTTRPLHAMSMDRFAPDIFSRTSARTGSPIYGIAFTYIVALIAVAAAAKFELLLAIGGWIAGSIMFMLWGVSEALLPYRRREIWDNGPRWTIGKLPLDVPVGIFNALVMAYLLIISWSSQNTVSRVFTVILWTVGLIVYIIYYFYNKRKGIDINAIFRSVPPA
jgi:basic amino acid/polyamine antiporter, APA family